MRKNASILIFVLFMMIVVSLYAILIAIFVKNIINRSGIFHRFEKTYYLAYAGIELELTKTKYHQRGFEDNITSGSDTNKKNWGCKNCYIEVKNKNLSKVVGGSWKILEQNAENCSSIPEDYYLQIKDTGEGIVLPLFKDKDSSLNFETHLSGGQIQKITNFTPINLYRKGSIGVHYLFSITDGSTTYTFTGKTTNNIGNIQLASTLPTFSQDKIFWGFFQKTNTNMLYCFEFNSKVPTNYNFITSKGLYHHFTLILKSIKENKIPTYIVYSIIK